jgi:phytoene dehydrogenase-like protein
MNFDCIVIGAGLAGITAARDLESTGKNVLLIEASDDVGGRLRSDRVDGFILDRGFQVINPKYPQIKRSKLIKELDFKFISGKIHLADLDLMVGYAPGSLSQKIGPTNEKIKFLNFLTLSKPSNSQAFGDFTTVFPTLYAKVLKPFLSGVFLTDPQLIAADVVQEIVRSLAKSLPGVPANGVGEFSKALAKLLKNVHFNEKVIKIEQGSVFTTKGQYEARFIVIATDGQNANNLMGLNKECKMSASYTFYFALDKQFELMSSLQISTQAKVVNTIAMSKVSQNYAPKDKNLISVTSLQPLSEDGFRQEVSKLWRIPAEKFEYIHHYAITQSLPFYGPGKSRTENLFVKDGLFVVGDHMSAPSQEGAMRTGAAVALKINQLMR